MDAAMKKKLNDTKEQQQSNRVQVIHYATKQISNDSTDNNIDFAEDNIIKKSKRDEKKQQERIESQEIASIKSYNTQVNVPSLWMKINLNRLNVNLNESTFMNLQSDGSSTEIDEDATEMQTNFNPLDVSLEGTQNKEEDIEELNDESLPFTFEIPNNLTSPDKVQVKDNANESQTEEERIKTDGKYNENSVLYYEINNYKKNRKRTKQTITTLEAKTIRQKYKKIGKLFSIYFGNCSDSENEEDVAAMLKAEEKKIMRDFHFSTTKEANMQDILQNPQETRYSRDENIVSSKVETLPEERSLEEIYVNDKNKDDSDILPNAAHLANNDSTMSNVMLNNTLVSTTMTSKIQPTKMTTKALSMPILETSKSSVSAKDVPSANDDEDNGELEIKIKPKSKSRIPQFSLKMSLPSMNIANSQNLSTFKYNANALLGKFLQDINSILKDSVLVNEDNRNDENDAARKPLKINNPVTKIAETVLNIQSVVSVKESSLSSQTVTDNAVPFLQQQDSLNNVTSTEGINAKHSDEERDKECAQSCEPKMTPAITESNPKSVESTNSNKQSSNISLSNEEKNVAKNISKHCDIKVRSLQELIAPTCIATLPVTFYATVTTSNTSYSTSSQLPSGLPSANNIPVNVSLMTNPLCTPIESNPPNFNKDILHNVRYLVESICTKFEFCRNFYSYNIDNERIRIFYANLIQIRKEINILKYHWGVSNVIDYVNQFMRLTPPISTEEYNFYLIHAKKLESLCNCYILQQNVNINYPRYPSSSANTSLGSSVSSTSTQPIIHLPSTTTQSYALVANTPLNFNSTASINAQQSFGHVSSSLSANTKLANFGNPQFSAVPPVNQVISNNDQGKTHNFLHTSPRQPAPNMYQQYKNPVSSMTQSHVPKWNANQQPMLENNYVMHPRNINDQQFSGNVTNVPHTTLSSDARSNSILCAICSKVECQHNRTASIPMKVYSPIALNTSTTVSSVFTTNMYTSNLQTSFQGNMGMPMNPPSISNSSVSLDTHQNASNITAIPSLTRFPNASSNSLAIASTSNLTTNSTLGNPSPTQQTQVSSSVFLQFVPQKKNTSSTRKTATIMPSQDANRNSQPSNQRTTPLTISNRNVQDLEQSSQSTNVLTDILVCLNNPSSNISKPLNKISKPTSRSKSTLNKAVNLQENQTRSDTRDVTQTCTTKASSQLQQVLLFSQTTSKPSTLRKKPVLLSANCTKADPTDYDLYYKFNLSFLTDIQKILLRQILQQYITMPQNVKTQQEYENLLREAEKLLFFYISLDTHLNKITEFQARKCDTNKNQQMQLPMTDSNNLNNSIKAKSTSNKSMREIGKKSTPKSPTIDCVVPSEVVLQADDKDVLLLQNTRIAGECSRTIGATSGKNSRVKTRDNTTVDQASGENLRNTRLSELSSSPNIPLQDVSADKRRNQSCRMSDIQESCTIKETSNIMVNICETSDVIQRNINEGNNVKSSSDTENESNRGKDMITKVPVLTNKDLRNRNETETSVNNITSSFFTENQFNPSCTSSIFVSSSSNNVSEILVPNKSKSVDESLADVRNAKQVNLINGSNLHFEDEKPCDNNEINESIDSQRLCIDESADSIDLESYSNFDKSSENIELDQLQVSSPEVYCLNPDTSTDPTDLYAFAIEKKDTTVRKKSIRRKQASRAEETQKSAGVAEVASVIKGNAMQSIDSVSKEMQREDIDTHSNIKLFSKQMRNVLEQSYQQKSRVDNSVVVESDCLISDLKQCAFNDSNAEIAEGSPVDCVSPNVCNIRSISPSLFEKLDGTDAAHQELESLTKGENSSSAEKNLKDEQEKEPRPCLRCKKKSTVRCANCLRATYCSKRCAHLHWKASHYENCERTFSSEASPSTGSS